MNYDLYDGESTPKPPKKRIHPAVIPIVLLCVMFLSGLGLFFLVPLETAAADKPAVNHPTVPEKTDIEETLPTERIVQTDCYMLEDGVLTFLPGAYSGGRVLTVPASIDGQTVTAIGARCFYGCEEITTIILPDTITSIGDAAFAECTALRGLFVPESVTSIGTDAFLNCLDLEAVYIPMSMDSIGTGAFEGCPALHYIFFSGYYASWNALYSDYITPFTYVICLDGDYHHGINLP